MAVYLVCEGSRQGLDDRLLDALVIQKHNLAVLTAASGGSSGLRAIRSYLEGRSVHDVAAAVEDRNHRPFAQADATWTNQSGRSFIWRRHKIENYLLHPRVVLALFDELRAVPHLRWAVGLPATEPDVDTLLQTLATPLLADHAAEVLRDEFVRQINAAGVVGFSMRRPAPPAGAYAPGQPEWLAAFLNEATRLSQACTVVAGLPILQGAEITMRYDATVAQFQQPAFLTSGDYLRDMGGHELVGALSRHLHNLGSGNRFTQGFLSDELLRLLNQLYRPRTFFQPDDFDELAAILSRY